MQDAWGFHGSGQARGLLHPRLAQTIDFLPPAGGGPLVTKPGSWLALPAVGVVERLFGVVGRLLPGEAPAARSR